VGRLDESGVGFACVAPLHRAPRLSPRFAQYVIRKRLHFGVSAGQGIKNFFQNFPGASARERAPSGNLLRSASWRPGDVSLSSGRRLSTRTRECSRARQLGGKQSPNYTGEFGSKSCASGLARGGGGDGGVPAGGGCVCALGPRLLTSCRRVNGLERRARESAREARRRWCGA